VLHAVLMPIFRFVIEEVLSSIAGFEGPVIAGPVLDASARLRVGDWLNINTSSGQIQVRCEGFPLINWGRRGNWVSITVLGLPSSVDVLGLVAETSGER
jgi:hypothetical protein